MTSDEDWAKFKERDREKSRAVKVNFFVALLAVIFVSLVVTLNVDWIIGGCTFVILFLVVYLVFRRSLRGIMMQEGPWPPKE